MVKSKQKYELERIKIIEKAAEVFNSTGYHKTKIETIAREAGKAKSTVYYYYKSKDEIFRAVVLREAIQFRRSVIDALDKNDAPIDKIKIYILTRMKILNKYKNFYSALKYEPLENMEFIKRLNSFYDREEIRLFKNILIEGVDKKYFKIYDIDLAAVGIVMAIKGIENMIIRETDAAFISDKIKDLINIILYGIAKK